MCDKCSSLLVLALFMAAAEAAPGNIGGGKTLVGTIGPDCVLHCKFNIGFWNKRGFDNSLPNLPPLAGLCAYFWKVEGIMHLLRSKAFFEGASILVLRMSHSFTASPIFPSTAWNVLLDLGLERGNPSVADAHDKTIGKECLPTLPPIFLLLLTSLCA